VVIIGHVIIPWNEIYLSKIQSSWVKEYLHVRPKKKSTSGKKTNSFMGETWEKLVCIGVTGKYIRKAT
jgi:hypothetical protein